MSEEAEEEQWIQLTGSPRPLPLPIELHFPEGPVSRACVPERKEAATRSFTLAVFSSESQTRLSRSEAEPELRPEGGGALNLPRRPLQLGEKGTSGHLLVARTRVLGRGGD